jgi:diguanylate cyclase
MLLILVGVAVLWCGAAWLVVSRLADEWQRRLISQERGVAVVDATMISSNLGTKTEHLQYLPTVLAREPSLVSALKRFGPDVAASALPAKRQQAAWKADRDLSALARQLNALVPEVMTSQFLVINAAGDCIASGGYASSASDSTGVNYADRDYFLAGREGRHGRQFAVGRTTNIPGLFYSSPVFGGGRFLGVVVVKMDLDHYAFIVKDVDAFVTDENGVIILTNDPRLLMHTVPGARIAKVSQLDRQRRYRMSSFLPVRMDPVDLDGQPAIIRWEGQSTPSILVEQARTGDFLKIHVLRSLRGIEAMRHERISLFLLLSLTGMLLVLLAGGSIVYLRRISAHRREMTRLNRALAYQAGTDPLTGCANRRCFLAALDAEFRRTRRYGHPLSVISLDLDHFKAINDQYGHSGGDEALRHFTLVVKAVLRSADLLGRLGGEEFTILLTETGFEQAALLAERVRAIIEATPVQFGDEQIPMTISGGIAQLQEGESVEQLLDRADKVLYQAKSGGRNRVVCLGVDQAMAGAHS